MAVLGVLKADLYDWAEAGTDEGDALVDGERSGYRQVAAVLRARILGDGPDYPPRSAIPGNGLLAEELNADIAVVNRAVSELAREGLVELNGRGRRTIVLEQRRWHVAVTVPRAGDPAIPFGIVDSATSSLAAAAGADPAVSGLAASYVLVAAVPDAPGGPALVTAMDVLAADVGIAGVRAWGLVRDALRGHDGWDLDEPSASARPA
jgi:Bacterial regulatory proteins, gntR family